MISFETARSPGCLTGIRGSKLRANLIFADGIIPDVLPVSAAANYVPNLDFFAGSVIPDAPPISAATNYVPDLDFF